jgi:hypothetical protein
MSGKKSRIPTIPGNPFQGAIDVVNEQLAEGETVNSQAMPDPPNSNIASTEAPPTRTRKPRDKTEYLIEIKDNGTAGGWVAYDHSTDSTDDPDFADTAAAVAWAQDNIPAPARVRVIIVKAEFELEEQTVKKTVVKLVKP